MKEKWQQLKTRFESFAVRERCLMVGAIAAVIYLLWDFVLLQPMAEKMEILTARERVVKQALQTGEAELAVLSAIAQKDPDIELKRNLQELQEKLRQLDGQLDTLSAGLVAAQKLPQVLHYVLHESSAVRDAGGLSIVSMATRPPEEIVLSKEKEVASTPQVQTETEAAAAAPAVLETVKIYKHGVNLKLTGDFVSAVRYLQALEQGEWRFYWESLKYQVSRYPQAEIQLTVFTLSSQRGIFDAP